MELVHDVESVLEHKGHQVWFIGPDASAFDAIRWMEAKEVGALLVMDGGELLGIVSEGDYTRHVVLEDRPSKNTKVREIMTTRLIVIPRTTTVVEAMHIMAHNHVHHLPVMDQGRIIGVVSIGDLVERTITVQQLVMDQLENYIIGRYPG